MYLSNHRLGLRFFCFLSLLQSRLVQWTTKATNHANEAEQSNEKHNACCLKIEA